MRTTLFATLTLLLIGAVALIIYGSTRSLEQTFHGKLADLLPDPPQGWTRTLRPIADTPEMQKAVGEILHYDDGVFADYTYGRERVSVYIAYWTPGKMQHRQIASHTPDVCWTLAGWNCTERGVARPGISGHFFAEARTFTAKGTTEYVWYWHMVNGKPVSYSTDKLPPWYAFITDVVTLGFHQREEQFFLRLSATSPLESAVLSPTVTALLHALPLPNEPSHSAH